MTESGSPYNFASPAPAPVPSPAPAPRRGLNVASCLLLVMFGVSLAMNALLLVMLVGALGGAAAENGTVEHNLAGNASADKKIAVIPIRGVIASGASSSPLFGSTTDVVERAIRDLRRAREDRNVVAVILDVNSPGGGITDCDRIHHEIMEFRKARPEVKFVSLMRDVAASGGYYVSAPCDRIIAHPTTITGSIGVIMSFMNLQGLFEKIGYKEEVIKSGDHKDIGSMGREMTADERAMLQKMLMEMYERFVTVVAEGRKMDPAQVRILADGRIYTGTQAKENKLVDELGYFETAVEEAKKLAGVQDANVIEYQKPFSFQDLLRAKADPPSAEAVVAGELSRLLGHRGGFYYLWTVK